MNVAPGNKNAARMVGTHPDGKAKAETEPPPMTTLFDATRPVKTTRPARRFGAGILPTYPVYMSDHTAADEAWWAAESARMEDARIDRQAAESAALDALTRGLVFA